MQKSKVSDDSAQKSRCDLRMSSKDIILHFQADSPALNGKTADSSSIDSGESPNEAAKAKNASKLNKKTEDGAEEHDEDDTG